jgi:hypothetical protein
MTRTVTPARVRCKCGAQNFPTDADCMTCGAPLRLDGHPGYDARPPSRPVESLPHLRLHSWTFHPQPDGTLVIRSTPATRRFVFWSLALGAAVLYSLALVEAAYILQYAQRALGTVELWNLGVLGTTASVFALLATFCALRRKECRVTPDTLEVNGYLGHYLLPPLRWSSPAVFQWTYRLTKPELRYYRFPRVLYVCATDGRGLLADSYSLAFLASPTEIERFAEALAAVTGWRLVCRSYLPLNVTPGSEGPDEPAVAPRAPHARS